MMACKADEIKRNWEYGWSEPDQNWIWPISDEQLKSPGILMQDGFVRGNTVIGKFVRDAIGHLEPDSEVSILVAKTDEGIELTSAEIAEFKERCRNNEVPWIVVNAKHIVVDASFCRYVGKHVEDIYEESSQRGGSPSE